MKYIAATMIALFFLLAAGCAGENDALNDSIPPQQIQPAETTDVTASPQPNDTTDQTEATNCVADDHSPVRFLTNLNLHGSFLHDADDEPVPPGSLTEIADIPVYDQELIGQTVALVLSGDDLRTSFYYKTGDKERLVLIIGEFNIPLLMVFEPDLGSADGLFQKIASEEPFEATILAAVNISFEEGMYARNAAKSTQDIPDSEVFNIGNAVTDAPDGEYIGIVGLDNDEIIKIAKGADVNEASDALKDDINIFHRIFDRFDLNQYLA